MTNQKGIAHLFALLLVVIIGVALYFLISLGFIKNPFSKLPFIGQKTPEVTLKTEYKNPFDKKTQYVNPFETYKNPFALK